MLKISLNKLLNTKSQLKVLTEINNNDGVFIPRSISKDLPIYFAIDNTDLKIDTPDGQNQLHGTRIAVYQKTETSKVLQLVSIERQSKPKNSPGRFIVSSIAQNQSARTIIILFTKTTFLAKL